MRPVTACNRGEIAHLEPVVILRRPTDSELANPQESAMASPATSKRHPDPDMPGAGRSRRTGWLLAGLAALGFLLHSPLAQAAVVEEVVTAPVALQTAFGPHRQDIVVTVFYDDERQASPYVVINHGRTSNEEKREKMGRQRYSKISRYLVSLGFTVLVPTRIGYGVTGGPDVEYFGPCRGRDYGPDFALAADEVEAVL